MLLDSLSEVQSVIREINQLANFYKESASPMERMLATDSTPQERKMMQRIKEIETYTLPLVKQIITLRLQGNRVDSKEILLTRAKPAFIDWLAAINAFIDYQEQQNQVETDEVRTATGAFTGVMISATTIAILIAILVTWLFIAYFKRQLGGEPHEIAEILHTMANGKIGNHVESKHSGSVLHSLSRLQHQLTLHTVLLQAKLFPSQTSIPLIVRSLRDESQPSFQELLHASQASRSRCFKEHILWDIGALRIQRNVSTK